MNPDSSISKSFRGSARHSRSVSAELSRLYPDSRCALEYRDLFELIVATILSAQCTDKRVNMVTPGLFARYPDASALAVAEPADLEKIIHSTGFYKAKSKNLIAMAKGLMTNHHGQVPETIDELTKLAGVGRKTANVVLGVGRGITSGIVVDTHVTRLSNRLGLTRQSSAVAIERDLIKVIPKSDWVLISLRMIDHGRAVCKAGRPACSRCELSGICPKVGVLEPSPKPKSAKLNAIEVGLTKRKSGVAKSARIGTIDPVVAKPKRAKSSSGKTNG
jgi:endonuclease-3